MADGFRHVVAALAMLANTRTGFETAATAYEICRYRSVIRAQRTKMVDNSRDRTTAVFQHFRVLPSWCFLREQDQPSGRDR